MADVKDNQIVVEEPTVTKRLSSANVHDVVMEEGEEELKRSFSALMWSGIAAGLSIGFSVVASAALAKAFGHEAGAHPIVSIGYSAGFIIVILARQQLFTENTITALLPVITGRSWVGIQHMLRLWGIVFCANVIGAAIFAFATTQSIIFSPDLQDHIRKISLHMIENTPIEMFGKGIASGWLIAALVWVLPTVKAGKFWIILFFTWLIALGEFTHVVAGSVEAFHLLFKGDVDISMMVFGFMLPTLAGNVVGGSAIFSLISYAQVRNEIE